MKTKMLLLPVFGVLAFTTQRAYAQTDPHFTQHYTYPLYINPAMTGSGAGEYRASAIYRTQWGAIGNPYRTTGLSFDAPTRDNIALGGNLMHQAAGDGGFSYFNAYATFAYTGVKFGKNDEHRLVLALQAGVINRRVDQSKFKWGEQWNPITGYNANNPISETFASSSATTLDVGTGILYYNASSERKTNVFAGASMFHLNKPRDPIVYRQYATLPTIPYRYTVHGGISIKLPQRFMLVPHALYMQQGNARETALGVYLQKEVNEQTSVMLGGYYRLKDAAAPFFGIDYKNLLMGFSYDANVSELGARARNINSFEVTLTYTMRKGTPGFFDFLHCPRL